MVGKDDSVFQHLADAATAIFLTGHEGEGKLSTPQLGGSFREWRCEGEGVRTRVKVGKGGVGEEEGECVRGRESEGGEGVRRREEL